MDQISFELKVDLFADDVCELELLLRGSRFEFITDSFYKQISDEFDDYENKNR